MIRILLVRRNLGEQLNSLWAHVLPSHKRRAGGPTEAQVANRTDPTTATNAIRGSEEPVTVELSCFTASRLYHYQVLLNLKRLV